MHEQAGVRGGEAVHVLARVDQLDELVLVEVCGQRELEQDAVHALVRIERADQLGQRGRLHIGAGLVVEGLETHLGGVLALHPHVYGGGGVVAHEDCGQPGLQAELGHLRGHARAHALRHGLTVDHLR